MSWLVMAVGVIAFVELVRLLPLLHHLHQLARCASRSLRVIRSPAISDHWKERVLLAYAGRILVSSLAALALLLVAVAPLAAVAGAARWLGLDVVALLGSPLGIAGATAIASVHLWLRRRLGKG